jgi:phosphate transport system permease protein
VYQLHLGHTILTAGLTLGLLCLPVVIITTREAIRTVPLAIREAAYALGATQWQTIRDHILPYSTGGILTGVIIALSRAIGETAPLITIGALSFAAFLPASPVTADPPFLSVRWLLDPFAVLPMQMFNWISRPQEAFHLNAAGAGLILILVTLAMNGLAFYLRFRSRRRVYW